MVKRRYYAVRIGGYVELRATIKGIKAITSTLTRQLSPRKKLVMTQTHYEGGKVLMAWDYTYFVRDAKQAIPEEGIIPISVSLAKELLKHGNR